MQEDRDSFGDPSTVSHRVRVSREICVNVGYAVKCPVDNDTYRPVKAHDLGCRNQIQRKGNLARVKGVDWVRDPDLSSPFDEPFLKVPALVIQLELEDFPVF